MQKHPDFEWEISIAFYGENFSPRKLLSLASLPLENCIEKGDSLTIKKFEKIYETGTAQTKILVNSNSDKTDEFDELLDMVIDNYTAIKESGVENISVWVAIFQSLQGNWSATAEQIQKIAAFNGSLAVTYYRDE